MKKVAIFQSDLNVGGIQTSLINLLRNFKDEEYEIDLYLFNKQNFYTVDFPKSVNIIYLSPLPFWNKIIFFKLLKNLVKRYNFSKNYDVAIDFNGYSNECALACLATSAQKYVIWIHNDLKMRLKYNLKYKILYFFGKKKFSYFKNIVGVSQGVIDSFKEIIALNFNSINTDVISNIIDTKDIFNKSQQDITEKINPDNYNLVSVGRLYNAKGFDLLLNDFEKVVKQRQDIHLYIIGDGPDKSKLKLQANKLKISGFISFLGNKQNPYAFMNRMDGFVLESRYEGQGMVLLEAKALGLTLFFAKRLEKYNCNLFGQEDIVFALINAKRDTKIKDYLTDYNVEILNKFSKLIKH